MLLAIARAFHVFLISRMQVWQVPRGMQGHADRG